jgi:dienelactone hydrolase
MAIRVDCGYCGRIHKLGEQFAGKTIACVACKTPIDVPAAAVSKATKPKPPAPSDTWELPAAAPPAAAPAKYRSGKPTPRRRITLAPENSDSWLFEVPEPDAAPKPTPGWPAVDADEEEPLEPPEPAPEAPANEAESAVPTDFWEDDADTVTTSRREEHRLPPPAVQVADDSGEFLSPADIPQPVKSGKRDKAGKNKARAANAKWLRSEFVTAHAETFKLIGLVFVILVATATLFPKFVRRLERNLGLRSRPAASTPIPASTAALAAPADAASLFPVSETPAPVFPEFEPEPGEHLVTLRGSFNSPGGATQLAVYIPSGEHSEKSLPCILTAPAGTNLLTGTRVGSKDRPEHVAYLAAGYVVVCYSLDGHFDKRDKSATRAGSVEAYHRFVAAHAGLANARNALEFVLAKIPAVDPLRIYAAGHGSAATMALLFAEHEPRLQGCVAYAPVTDLERQFRIAFADPDEPERIPGITTLARRMSPQTHAASIGCPVFLFYADNDNVNMVRDIGRFAEQLHALGKQAAICHVPTGGHHDSMLVTGIPEATAWLRTLPGNRTAGVAPPTFPTRQSAPPPSMQPSVQLPQLRPAESSQPAF